MKAKGNVSRRGFLAGAVAATGTFAIGGGSPRTARPTAAPNMSFGVLSDVHLEKKGDEDTLVKALEYFRDNGADGVMIAGDIANTGRIEQIERAARCFWRVFPDGKAPDGRHVEQLWVYGNHDVARWGWTKGKDEDYLKKNLIAQGNNRALTVRARSRLSSAGRKRLRRPAGGEVLHWFCDRMPGSGLKFTPVNIFIPETLEDPVWVEMITGRVFEIPATSVESREGGIGVKSVPMWDSPILIAPRAAIPMR